MRLPTFEHLQPSNLSEACRMMADHGSAARVIAGGTDLLVRMKQGVTAPSCLVNVKRVEEMRQIRCDADGLHIGAAVTLGEIHRSAEIRERATPLAEAALGVGAAQLQNMGTLGGNLCLETRCWYYQQGPSWRQARPPCFKIGGDLCYMAKGSKRCYALYSGDTAAALLALGAELRVAGPNGERIVPLREFYLDDGVKHTVLQADELLAEIRIPKQHEGQRGCYLKYRKRGAIDYPVAGVAATVATEGSNCRSLRVAVTGAGSVPFLVDGCSELAQGKPLTTEILDAVAETAWKQARPVSRMEVSPSYRKRLVRVLTRDALEKAINPDFPVDTACGRNQR